MIPAAGRDYLLGCGVAGTTQITSWFVGLIAYAATTELDDDDTMSSHAGWTESTAYSESTRPTMSFAAVSGQQSLGTGGTFTFNADATVYGVFVTSSSTKSGTSGTLIHTIPFASPRSFTNGETFSPIVDLRAQQGNV